MDWQSFSVIVIILLAVGYLAWNYRRRKAKSGACANCMAHHKVTANRRSVTKD